MTRYRAERKALGKGTVLRWTTAPDIIAAWAWAVALRYPGTLAVYECPALELVS